MDKKSANDIEYVKPQALDLGALTIMYGALCPSGLQATNTCTDGLGASGGECGSQGQDAASCIAGDGDFT